MVAKFRSMVLIGALAASCEAGPATRPQATALPANLLGAGHTRPDLSGPRITPAPNIPAALAIELLQKRQRDAGPEYAVVEEAGPAWTARAENSAHRFDVQFGGHALRIVPENDSPELGLELVGFGRGEALAAPSSPEERRIEGAKTRYLRGEGLEEWYLNGPLGLEQGFEITTRPRGDASQPVGLAVAVSGDLVPRLEGDTVALTRPDGRVALRYGKLYVVDARGTPVPSSLRVVEREILLTLDDRNARYPVSVDPFVWTEEQTLTTSGTMGSWFGSALSIDGDTALIGEKFAGSSYFGAAHVYTSSAGAWFEEQTLTASDAAAINEFGNAVALDGDTAFVASHLDDDAGADAGAVYVFTLSGGTWTQQQKLIASDASAGAEFGISLSLDGDTLLVGAFRDGDGAAYIFERSGGSWTEQQKLTPSDAQGSALGKAFGFAVALDGDSALITAGLDVISPTRRGSAYAFARSAGVWTEQQKLIPSDEILYFGESVSLDGNSAIIGAAGDDAAGTRSGSAYVFVQTAGTWVQQQQLIASDASSYDFFGRSVALDGDTAIVGADQGAVQPDTGAAYIFTRNAGVWTESQKLTASNGQVQSYFGWTVAVEGDMAFVGAVTHPMGQTYGAVYVFDTFRSVVYVAPVAGDVVGTTPTLTWQPNPDATSYDIRVDDSAGNVVDLQGLSPASLGGCAPCSFTVTQPLDSGTGRWWVRPNDGIGTGSWGAGETFTVVGGPPPTPSGFTVTATDAAPTFSWDEVPSATSYNIWVNDSSGFRYDLEVAPTCNAGLCAVKPATVLNPGSGRAWIQANNSFGTSNWSPREDFTIAGTLPARPTGFTTPAIDTTPVFSWDEVPNATTYDVWVNDATGFRYNLQVAPTCAAGTCSFEPTTILNPGAAVAWIQANNGVGSSGWSPRLDFVVPGSPPSTPTGFTTNTTDSTPVFAWNEVANAITYNLWVEDSTGFRYNLEVTPTCAGGICSFEPATALNPGPGEAWILANNTAGSSGWSPRLDFTVQSGLVVDRPQNLSAAPPPGPMPTLRWERVANATQYEVWINDSGGFVSNTVVTPTQAGCDATQGVVCSFDVPTLLMVGNATFWVRGSNPYSVGPWSLGHDFLVDDRPERPTGLGADPVAGVYFWNEVANADSYTVVLNDWSNVTGFYYSASHTPGDGNLVCAGGVCTLSGAPVPPLPFPRSMDVAAVNSTGGSGFTTYDFPLP